MAQSPQDPARDVDAILEIRDPDGLSSDIFVEVKTNPLEPRLVAFVASRLKSLFASRRVESGEPETKPAILLVSTYLSPLTRERLEKAEISYADSTGNLRLAVDRPAVFIETVGAEKHPFRERSLKGRRTARVARGLLDYRTPFGTRELAAETANSPAMISRVCGLLEPDEIVTKDGRRGRIVLVDWEALARRWAADYDFASSNFLTTWLEPRGARALLGRLADASFYRCSRGAAGRRGCAGTPQRCGHPGGRAGNLQTRRERGDELCTLSLHL